MVMFCVSNFYCITFTKGCLRITISRCVQIPGGLERKCVPPVSTECLLVGFCQFMIRCHFAKLEMQAKLPLINEQTPTFNVFNEKEIKKKSYLVNFYFLNVRSIFTDNVYTILNCAVYSGRDQYA